MRNTIKEFFRGSLSTEGQYVAEAWLDWGICTGSTLYREAFETREAAERAAETHKRKLQWDLPGTYRSVMVTKGFHLVPTRESYDFKVVCGVRTLTEEEQRNGITALWSPYLPGHPKDKGERYEHKPASKGHYSFDDDPAHCSKE